MRPGGLEAVAQCQVTIVRPQGIRGDVFHYDHLFAECRRSAGTSARPDCFAVDRLAVCLKRARGGRAHETRTALID